MRTSKIFSILLLGATAAFANLAASTPVGRGAGDYLGDPYTLTVCASCAKALPAESTTVVLDGMKDRALDGTQIKCCSTECVEAFKANPAGALAKVHAEILKTPATAYPLKNCFMMRDEVLDESAKSVVYQNRVYKVCCKKCAVRFGNDSAKRAKEWESLVIDAQKASYPLKTCVISGKPIEGDGAWVVVQNRAYHLCCPGCASGVRADPAKFAAMLDAASKTK